MSESSSKFKFAAIQLMVGSDKEKNLASASRSIREAAENGANVVCLPECFNCPYSVDSFGPYSEDVTNGPSAKMLQAAAKENGVVLIGGSFPEKDEGKVYNTSLIFGPDGQLLAKHRKVHLFDIDVPGKITFKESTTLSPGDTITTFRTRYGTMGVGICYDIRFPELAQLMAARGAKFLIYPGAFNMTTGPAHWELLQRARAVDNNTFVAAVAPARNPESVYQSWGHSTLVSPWGKVIASLEEKEGILYADIDLTEVDAMRQQIPCWSQKRADLYSLSSIEKP